LTPKPNNEIGAVELKDNDCLLFYTDGLIDAANFAGEFWGRQRLLETAKEFVKDSAEHVVRTFSGIDAGLWALPAKLTTQALS